MIPALAAHRDLNEALVQIIKEEPDAYADMIIEAATEVGEFGNGEGGLMGFLRRLDRSSI